MSFQTASVVLVSLLQRSLSIQRCRLAIPQHQSSRVPVWVMLCGLVLGNHQFCVSNWLRIPISAYTSVDAWMNLRLLIQHGLNAYVPPYCLSDAARLAHSHVTILCLGPIARMFYKDRTYYY